MIAQLTLPVQLHNDFTFANYYAGANQTLVDYLYSISVKQNSSAEKYIYLWGYGRSHLLQATCRNAQDNNLPAIYLPLAQIKQLNPELLEGLESTYLICLDNIESIAGNSQWEEAIFHLYNRCQMNECYLIISGDQLPKQLNIQLPDLLSRLNSSIILQIQSLADHEKLAALQLQANYRGFELSDETARFLLHHLPRDFKALFSFLDKLDHFSLAEQRKLSVPFVKKVLGT